MEYSRTNLAEHDIAVQRAAAKGKALKIVIIVALVLIAGLWIWKAIQVAQVRKEARQESEEVRQTALNTISQERTGQLELMVKPLVWAIRTEMLRGNMDQVNLYLQQMVKENNFQQLQVVDAKGVVVASTDKNTEGKPLKNPGQLLSANATEVNKTSEDQWVISSPIMGLNDRLGTLVIDYTHNKPKL